MDCVKCVTLSQHENISMHGVLVSQMGFVFSAQLLEKLVHHSSILWERSEKSGQQGGTVITESQCRRRSEDAGFSF